MTGLFAGTVTCAQAYVGAISKTPEERSSRMATMQAATSIGYVCGPGVGGALLLIGTMVWLPAFVPACTFVVRFRVALQCIVGLHTVHVLARFVLFVGTVYIVHLKVQALIGTPQLNMFDDGCIMRVQMHVFRV